MRIDPSPSVLGPVARSFAEGFSTRGRMRTARIPAQSQQKIGEVNGSFPM
jgi:hypothetical protein